MEKIETELGDKYEFYRANVQSVQINHPDAVPTIILIKGTHLLGSPITGAPETYEQLKQQIKDMASGN